MKVTKWNQETQRPGDSIEINPSTIRTVGSRINRDFMGRLLEGGCLTMGDGTILLVVETREVLEELRKVPEKPHFKDLKEEVSINSDDVGSLEEELL